MGFPSSSVLKNLPANSGDVGLIPELGRFPGGGNGNPFQYSYLENPMDRRNLAGYSPWGHKGVVHDLVSKQQQYSIQISLF